MPKRLPRQIEQKMRHALAQWHTWHCSPALTRAPTPVEVLTGGIGNYTILVRAETLFVLRIDGPNAQAFGLNRQVEYRVVCNASAAGLAPLPVYYNPELGALASEYIETQTEQASALAPTADLLRQIHRLPAVHFRLDLTDRLHRYEKQIELRGEKLPPRLADCRPAVLSILADADCEEQAPVLCHNDLHAGNRLTTRTGLIAIDWEYAAMGNPLFDLAVIAVTDGLNAAESGALLEHYLQRTPTDQEHSGFAQQQCLYRYLEILWYCACQPQQSEHNDSRVELLEVALKNYQR